MKKFNSRTIGLGNIRIRFIILFLVFLLPVYFIGFSIYLFGRNSITRQIQEAQANRVEFYIDGLTAEIARIRTLQYDFFSDVYLNRLTDTIDILSNYDRDINILYIKKGLVLIMSASRYITGATVMIPSMGRKITTGTIDDLGSEELALIAQHTNTSVPGIAYRENTICLYAAAFTGYNPRDRLMPKYFFEIQLSGSALKQSMEDLLQTGENFVCRWDGADFMYTSFKNASTAEGIARLFGKPNGSYTVNGERYQIYQTALEQLKLTYISAMNERLLYRPLNRYLWLFLLFSVVVFTIIILFSHYFRKMIHVPLKRLHDAFREVENGVFDIHIEHPGQDEFKDLYKSFNQMTGKLNQLIDQLFRQKMQVQKAELRQLQAQINPHFLFNCFFILSRRIQYHDTETASALASYLGEYFQYITRSARDQVPLQEEVRHARIYTEIQKARFGGRITVTFDELPPRYHEMTVDRLIIQPLIENAFEHGLENKAENGIVRVFFTESPGVLIISIEDNGEELTDTGIKDLQNLLIMPEDDFNNDAAEITSMVNIHRRVRRRMGEGAGIRIGRSSLGGLCTDLILTSAAAIQGGSGHV
jgi:two-component system sensor histidine kinase YesM